MKQEMVRSDGVRGGGGDGHAAASPSFLVHNMDNVNGQLRWAQSLATLWDFLEYKGRIGRTHVVLSKKGEPWGAKVMPTSCRSGHFPDGRGHMSMASDQS